LHDGLIHLAFNMWALWILGSQLERVLGRARFTGLYVGSLLAGAFGVLLVSPDVPTVGASGAVFGLMGAALMVQRAAGIDPWSSGLGAVIAVNLLITFAVPRISLGGHLGGLLGGVILGAVLVESLRRRWDTGVTLAVTAAVAVAFVAGSVWAAGTWTDPLL
ncbi:MAG: rhomboid family intramembrane serine protease, partial [Actinomyces sp.]